MNAVFPTPLPATPPVPRVELEALLALLGPRTARLMGTVSGTTAVTGTEFLDVSDDLPDSPGTLLLLPSASSLSLARLGALATSAAAAGASGIALKGSPERAPALAAVAESSGLPIVLVADRISWRLLDGQLTRYLGEAAFEEHTSPNQAQAEPLFAIANELAEVFGGSVAIEDLNRRILAYSSVPGQLIDTLRTHGILSRQVPESPFNDDQYRTVLRTDSPVIYPRLDDEEPRVALAIRAGNLPLGSIWAIDAHASETLSTERESAIRRAAALTSALLLDDLRLREANQRPREDRLRTLLTGIDLTGSEFAELGVPDEAGATLLAFALPNDDPVTLTQLRSTALRHLWLDRPDAVAVAHRGRVYALLPGTGPDAASESAAALLPLIDRLILPGTRVALAGPAHRPSEVANARALADRLIESALRSVDPGIPRVLTAQALRPLLVVERAAELLAGADELRDPALTALAARTSTRVIAETILVWLQCFGNVAQTASELGVHENTVRQRLRRAEDVHGIALDRADARLAAWLQLRAGL
ncbi:MULTISPECIES: CdaR family transcriptional regulator [unclassified Leucobacter]|uniref:PucR family transcriptional regulator n=1 Tax=unclassified Leucobacter TaxID=2621730 RepID=UPI00165DD634|nr:MULTISPECIES: PucR family transcriptional regulator [unclassified Leucobacter]MBC9937228.1 helix-turn-helix domain-containing protein [Leucobacter sp. cx-87]